MERVPARWRVLSSGPAVAVLLLVLAATPASAVQTSRTRSAATARTPTCAPGRRARTSVTSSSCAKGRSCAIRIFLDPPSDFIESHVCLSAVAFTERVPPGQCQYQESGAASDTYDITLPPS